MIFGSKELHEGPLRESLSRRDPVSYFITSVPLYDNQSNQINQINQINQTNQMNQMNQTHQTNQINQSTIQRLNDSTI